MAQFIYRSHKDINSSLSKLWVYVFLLATLVLRKRTNNIAKLVKKDFPDIEISSIVFGRHNYDFLNKQNVVGYRSINCIEHILEQIDRENIFISDEDIFNLEKYIGFSLTKISLC